MLVVTKIEQCPKCGSANIVKNGFTRHKNQRVLCKDCQKTTVLRRKKTIPIDPQLVVRSFLERLSLCGISRVFAISYYRAYQQLDLTCLLLPNFRTQVADCKQTNYTLEFDELCGFCGSKKNKQWLWAALCKETRQIVAYVIGDRSEETFRRLVRKIPLAYLRCQSFSDYWKCHIGYFVVKATMNRLVKKRVRRII